MRTSNGARPTAPHVLIAGHDLKFTAPIQEAIAAAGATFEKDVWASHTEHDEPTSRALLDRADVILCEWCLGNAAWYSRNKRPGQRLVVRMHRMEAYTDHPARVDIDNVDELICVSAHIAAEAIGRFGWDPGRLRVIPNSVDVARFRRDKSDSARFGLAMIGYVPRRKRLDLALDLLEALRREEPRFGLLLVGRPPSEFDWVFDRAEEVEFFRAALGRVQRSPLLRGAVDFMPFSDDLPSLLGRVGFVLSTSESEGHQVALAEGAASGAVPVILDRPGAAAQYPARWIHATTDEAAAAVAALGREEWRAEAVLAADHAMTWAPEKILPRWVEALGLEWRDAPSAGRPGLDRVLVNADQDG